MSIETLRICFNESRVLERTQAGTLLERVKVNEDKHVSAARCMKLNLPLGSRSQIVIYSDGLTDVAMAHRYVRPDGTLGTSGRPDPKWVFCCGAILREP